MWFGVQAGYQLVDFLGLEIQTWRKFIFSAARLQRAAIAS